MAKMDRCPCGVRAFASSSRAAALPVCSAPSNILNPRTIVAAIVTPPNVLRVTMSSS